MRVDLSLSRCLWDVSSSPANQRSAFRVRRPISFLDFPFARQRQPEAPEAARGHWGQEELPTRSGQVIHIRAGLGSPPVLMSASSVPVAHRGCTLPARGSPEGQGRSINRPDKVPELRCAKLLFRPNTSTLDLERLHFTAPRGPHPSAMAATVQCSAAMRRFGRAHARECGSANLAPNGRVCSPARRAIASRPAV